MDQADRAESQAAGLLPLVELAAAIWVLSKLE
jgi:hypothetical protein